MPNVPGLRSPYVKVGRLVYFGRMLDKIRLHAAGRLPADYQTNYGDTLPGVFDTRCCHFLGVKFAEIEHRVRHGGTDEQILAWCHEHGAKRTDEDCDVWNGFMMKRGWRDAGHVRLQQRIIESRLENKEILTFFDYIEYDEDRDPADERPWEKV